MKFISKNNHYRVVLKQGTPGNQQIGLASIPGLYVLFKDGMATVENPEEVELMLKHSGFGADFVKVEEQEKDPYALTRKSSEPEHDMIPLEGGVVGKNMNPKVKALSPAENKAAFDKLVQDTAMKLAPALAEKMIDEALKIKAAEKVIDTAEEKKSEVKDEKKDIKTKSNKK